MPRHDRYGVGGTTWGALWKVAQPDGAVSVRMMVPCALYLTADSVGQAREIATSFFGIPQEGAYDLFHEGDLYDEDGVPLRLADPEQQIDLVLYPGWGKARAEIEDYETELEEAE